MQIARQVVVGSVFHTSLSKASLGRHFEGWSMLGGLSRRLLLSAARSSSISEGCVGLGCRLMATRSADPTPSAASPDLVAAINDSKLLRTQCYVGGDWIDSSSGHTLEVGVSLGAATGRRQGGGGGAGGTDELELLFCPPPAPVRPPARSSTLPPARPLPRCRCVVPMRRGPPSRRRPRSLRRGAGAPARSAPPSCAGASHSLPAAANLLLAAGC